MIIYSYVWPENANSEQVGGIATGLNLSDTL